MVLKSLLCRGFAMYCKIFDFIVKCLTAQATKTVTLGPRVGPDPSRSAYYNEEKQTNEKKNEEGQNRVLKIGFSSIIEEKIEPKVEIQVKKPPKKTVSINENTEIIYPSNDKRKRKRSFDKLPSIDEQKPIKSILKVGSNLIDKQQGVEQGKIRVKRIKNINDIRTENHVEKL